MTVNEMVETLKTKGYRMTEYISMSNDTFTDYVKGFNLAMTTKKVKGTGETEVVAIYSNFEEELEEMGIKVGTILK